MAMKSKSVYALQWLSEQGITQAALARRYHRTPGAISRYAGGSRPVPGWMMLDLALLVQAVTPNGPGFAELFHVKPPVKLGDVAEFVEKERKQETA